MAQFDDASYAQALAFENARILNRLIVAMAWALLPISFIVIYFSVRDGWGAVQVLQLLAISVIWAMARVKRDTFTLQRSIIISVLVVGGATAEILKFGLFAPTFPLLAILPVIATAIGGLRWGLIAFGFILITTAAAAWWVMTTQPAAPIDFMTANFDFENWVSLILNVVIAISIGMYVIGALYRFHVTSHAKLNERNRELTKSQQQNIASNKLANLGHAMMEIDKGQFVECDTAFAEMHGRLVTDFVQWDTTASLVSTLVHEDDHEAAHDVRKRLLLGQPVISELRYRLPNGEIRYLRKSFSAANLPDQPMGFCSVICQDVTESKIAQNKVFQAQKMDAIGNLTGGVAHDFNNLLAVILGNLELLDEKITQDDQKKLVQNGIRATLRGADLTRNMLSFAQRAPLAPTNVDLNNLTRNLNTWIGRTLPADIAVETSLLAGLWSTRVDASSAESALLNLILNARDSMSQGGRLTIETSNVRVDEEYLGKRDEDVPPGRYVLLAVSDTGVGIPPNDLEHIFEPFFSTKPVGSGSGLGLPMLQGFMRQSGGFVRVYSEVNVGTTFKLYFAAAQGSEIKAQPSLPIGAVNVDGICAKILLVEDNLDVLEVIHKILSIAGFGVIVSMSGDDALKTFEKVPDIDLLLTDIVMPGDLQGTALAKAIRLTRPDLPVVFMSGYAKEATVHGNGLRPEDIRLMKPVGRTDLLHAIEKALAFRG